MNNNFLPINDGVLLLGSGISSVKPSNLPSGKFVVDEVVHRLVGNGEVRSKKISKYLSDTPFELLLNGHPNHEYLRKVFSTHYQSNDNFNIVHKAVVHKVMSGAVSVIITTNYDDCLESAFKKEGADYSCIVEEEDIQNWDKKLPLIFKIHGCVSKKESLVITLNQESRLPGWKHKLLYDLVGNQDLRIAGYSGLDFDICPVLFSGEVKPKSVYWLHRDRSRATPNAKRAESLGKAKLYETDFVGAFVLEEQVEINNNQSCSLINDLFSGLDENIINRWKFDLFNNLSLGRYMQSHIESHKDSCNGVFYQQLSCIDERKGKYISGVKNLDIARKEFKDKNDKYGSYLTTAGRCYTGGYYYKGIFRLIIARLYFVFSKNGLSKGTRASLDYLFALYLIGFSRKYKIRISFVRNWAFKLLNRASEEYADQGDWGGIYLCKVQADSLGNILDFERRTSLLSSDDGFNHLNNIVGIITSKRALNHGYYGDIDRAYEDIRKLLYFMLYPAILLVIEAAPTEKWNTSSYKYKRIKMACLKSFRECEFSQERKLELENTLNVIFKNTIIMA